MSNKKKSKLSRRITWRVIGIMVFFNAFIIGALIIFGIGISELGSTSRGRYIIDGIDGKLTTLFEAVEVAARNNVAELEAHLDSPESVFDALEHEFRLNSGFLGCFAAFEPDYFPSQGRWFEAYVSSGDSAKIIRRQIGSAHHDYLKTEWYQQGFENATQERGRMIGPYFDEEGAKQLLCSYVVPVFDRNGRKVGVYGIDLDLEWLKKTISNEEGAYFTRMFDDSTYMANQHEYNTLPVFIQIMDSKGKKIAGSGNLSGEALKEIMEKDKIYFEEMTVNGTYYSISAKKISTSGYTLVVGQHWRMVYLWGVLLGIVVLALMTVGGLVIFFFTNKSIRHATKPLDILSESAQEVAHGNFNTVLPTFKHNDEVAQLRDSFSTMQQSLKMYIEELKESTAAKASIESELHVAHNIQMSMLPKTFPAFPNRKDIEVYGSLTPAKGVGGDLYDFFIHDEKLFFCVGDVSGKGVPASLVMAVTRTLFRNVAAHTEEPGRIVTTMNENISEGNDNNMFVTLFIGVLDLQTGHLRYCNAGHDAPYILNEQGNTTDKENMTVLPVDSNLPIGVLPDMTFSEQEMTIARGTTIFLYTDGLTEAENVNHELFGEERIVETITGFGSGPQELIEKVTGAVHQFVGDYEQSDDLTMLAIQIKK